MRLRRAIARWLFNTTKLLIPVTFIVALLFAGHTRWWLGALWLVIGFPLSGVVVGGLTTPVIRVLVGGWSRDQQAIGDWLATVPRPRP